VATTIKILLPFLLGIWIALGLSIGCPTETGGNRIVFTATRLFLPVLMSMSAATILTGIKGNTGRAGYITGFLIYVCLGYLLASVRQSPIPELPATTYMGYIQAPPVPQKSSWRFPLVLIASRTGDNWTAQDGRVMMVVSAKGPGWIDEEAPKTEFSHTGDGIPSEGNLIIFKGYCRPIPPEGAHPYERNLLRRHITHQVYLTQGQWKLLRTNCLKGVRRQAVLAREKILEVLRKEGLAGRELGITAAMILGYKAALDQETRALFADSGTAHLLAISGMHTGIIFLMVSGGLRILGRKPAAQTIRTILLLGFLWFFACMTGLAPSVVRASAMLSLGLLSYGMQRPCPLWQPWAASALLLTALQPEMLFDIGFQMSYMAVGALLMYLRVPAFRRHSERSGWRQRRDGRCISRGIQEVLRLLRVSVAAQAGTAPLTLHYFGQFPVWFAITNLVAVPLASCIIFASVIFLILHPIPLAGLWAAQGLKWLVQLLLGVTEWSSSLPWATIQNIVLPPEQVVCFYLVLGGTGGWYQTRDVRYLYGLLATGCLWLLSYPAYP